MSIRTPNTDIIRQKYPELAPAFEVHEKAINSGFSQVNVDPSRGAIAAPEQIAGFSVTEANGIHDIQITDNSKAYRGLGYHAYYSQDQKNWHRVDLGSAKNARVNLGSGKYYWSANSGYDTSDRSALVYHGGGTPQAVGSGAYAGPPMSTGQNDFGAEPQYRNSTTAPKR